MEDTSPIALDSGEDRLVVHRGMYYDHGPSPSPFVLKLETWLRMNKVKYHPDSNLRNSKHPVTGKLPWAEWRGENLPDSSNIIDTLKRDLDIRLDNDLSDKDLAVGRAFQKMLEEETYWCSGLWRTNYSDSGRHIADHAFGRILSFFMYPIHRHQFTKNAWGHGIGRRDKESVLKMARDDLKAVSDYLGDKKYFLRDDRPSTVDATIFGVLGNMMYGMPDSCFRAWMEEDFKNLKDYCGRMKEEFWPDWDELCKKSSV